jgi:hypothetical protein
MNSLTKASAKSNATTNNNHACNFTVGKTPKQLMLRNSLLVGVKKFIMKDSNIKSLVQNFKIIDKAIENIDGLSRLAEPTKRRVRTHMEIKSAPEGMFFKVHDCIHIDLYYVIEGSLKFKFKPLAN